MEVSIVNIRKLKCTLQSLGPGQLPVKAIGLRSENRPRLSQYPLVASRKFQEA